MTDEYYREFYPTPKNLLFKMFDGVSLRAVGSVLEPSAGKGDIADYLFSRMCPAYHEVEKSQIDIDCIEINPELQHVLRGKGYRVVYDDFLRYNTYKRYDLIAMNPPFRDGIKHLQKALQMQENGGAIICILNAASIRNPSTMDAKNVLMQLEKYNAKITYLHNEFSKAYRSTDVEIALIRVDIPQRETSSILTELRQARMQDTADRDPTDIVEDDPTKKILSQYEFEAAAGTRLIREYNAMKPYMLNSFETDAPCSILNLQISGPNAWTYSNRTVTENQYLSELRDKYWSALFLSPQYQNKFTSNLIEKIKNELKNTKNYDFSEWNIRQLRQDMVSNLSEMIEKTILALFDTLSQKHHWNATDSKNIHYYNGWKTNSAYKVGKRVVIPIQLYDTWKYDRLTTYGRGFDELADLEKTLQYLDGKQTNSADLRKLIDEANKEHKTNIHCKYFDMIAYKKGTVHITFTDEKILKKFNLYGSQKRGWLPPVYGKVHYEDMTAEEKQVVDSFEGKKSYEETLSDSDFFLTGINRNLLLTA